MLFTKAPNDANLVYNGDFRKGLDGWSFTDQSESYGCPNAYAKAWVENGWAVIHAHSRYGKGILSQMFNGVKPQSAEVTYKAISPNGNCNVISINFLDSSGNVIAGFKYGEDSLVSTYSTTALTLLGQEYKVPFSSKYSSGKIKFLFDWENQALKAVWYSLESSYSEILKIVNLPYYVRLSKAEIRTDNSCCDSRNDAFGYFKDIKVI